MKVNHKQNALKLTARKIDIVTKYGKYSLMDHRNTPTPANQ